MSKTDIPARTLKPKLILTHPSFSILLNRHTDPTQTAKTIESLRGGKSPQRRGDATHWVPTGSTLEEKEKEEEKFSQCRTREFETCHCRS